MRPVYGEGPVNPLGIIFAESPGSEEASRSRLLVGATGQEFDKTLLSHGLLRARLFIVNVIACQPIGPKSDASMRQATACCRPFVLAQIRRFGPRPYVLTLGGWAYYSLHGEKLNIDRGRGFLRSWALDTMELANHNALEAIRLAGVKDAKKASKARASDGGGIKADHFSTKEK